MADEAESMRKSRIYILLAFLALIGAIAALFLYHPDSKPHSVTLTWQPPASQGGVVIVGYNVYRRPADASSYVKIAERVGGSHYDDRLVTGGRTYLYVVTSVDQSGRESRFSSSVTAEIP